MFTYGHWQFPLEFDPTEWYGFVYRIVDLDTSKQYIGKKALVSRQRRKVAGRKNRRVVLKESKWKIYTGSSKSLNAEIELRGMDRFEFRIESLHETKGSLYYQEVVSQITEDVLRATLPNGERKYWNGHIGAVKFVPPALTDREKQHRIW